METTTEYCNYTHQNDSNVTCESMEAEKSEKMASSNFSSIMQSSSVQSQHLVDINDDNNNNNVNKLNQNKRLAKERLSEEQCYQKTSNANLETCCTADSSCCKESLNLSFSEKTANNLIILDKVKNEPVQLLVDAPCSNKVKEQVENYVKEKMERYVIDALHFSQEIVIKYNDHKDVLSTCTIDQWKMVPEKTRHYGLTAKFTFECKNCHKIDHVYSESYEENVMDVNTAVIAGTLATGIGHTQLEQIMGSMGIHCMNDKMYTDRQSNVCQDALHEVTEKSMREAAEEEKRLAIENGDVTKDGIPFITVIIDGSWLRRTYGTHWNSCSGTAAIIGARTKKVLFFDVRNKYCVRCVRAANAGKESKDHKCDKNWACDQPSTGMESDIILQGFKESVAKYNLIYKTIVMDNDSNLYKIIRESKVYLQYDVVPKRIICSVHLSKNLCKNLRKAADSTQTIKKGQRGIGAVRSLIKNKIGSMRLRLKEVVTYRIKQKEDWESKVKMLKTDIMTIPNDVFGKCKVNVQYRNKKFLKTKNVIPLIKSFGLYDKIEKVFSDLSHHSESLLHNESTNAAEQLNSLICRGLGGKRINWGLKSQYRTRVTMQILQFNTGKCLSEFYKEKDKIVPHILDKVENKKLNKIAETRNRRERYGVVKGGRKRSSFNEKSSNKYYGKKHEDVDMSKEDMEREKNARMNELKLNQENRAKIQQDTIGNSKFHQWQSLEKKILFAENFETACSWKVSVNCATKVKKILYPSINIKEEAERQQYSIEQETCVKENIKTKLKCQVIECGIFIDSNYEFLAANPTALVGINGILLVVCPFEVASMSVEAAISKFPKLKKLFIKGDLEVLNKKSEIYYEVQGALHITKKNHCYLVIKTQVNEKMIKVDVDEDFWKRKMEKQLKFFFDKCLIPEMINSRHDRSMPIRNPPETCKILEEKEKKRQEKKVNVTATSSKKRKFEAFCELETEEKEGDCQYIGSYKIKRRREDISNEWVREFANNRIISYRHIRQVLTTPHKLLDDDVLDRLVRIMNNTDNPIFDIQSVLYIERPDSVEPVSKSAIQIIGGNYINHWRTVFYNHNSKEVFVYDSLSSVTDFKLKPIEIKYLSARLGFQVKSRNVTFKNMKVQQIDGSSCGLYAAAYAVSLYMGQEPSEICYTTQAMELRRHFLNIISSHKITGFPTVQNRQQ